MNTHKFKLEPYKGKTSRYTCPACNKHRAFARYIDQDTVEHLNPEVGRCNRESNCGYHYTPKQYFEANSTSVNINISLPPQVPASTMQVLSPSTIEPEIFKASLQGYSHNYFAAYLQSLFGTELANNLISRYYVGTSKQWKGATVFWQLDSQGRIRAGKIMLYDPVTGKRVKKPYDFITWVHSALKLEGYHLQQCFFGEHLLRKEPNKPVAIVESYKTAIIASGYLPDYVWLASDSLGGLNTEKCLALQGRKVLLYPDLKGYNKWSEKAKELAGIASFLISDLLERKASETEKAEGLDIADYLIKNSLEKHSTTYTLPKPELTEEFYSHSFDELETVLGYYRALDRVQYYLRLSGQYKTCENFIIHNCRLLTTYRQKQSEAA